ncbi:MAG: hypothetical protein NTV51_03585, partial [Verrucomicrobia bacterium]|nr:hypothetical protein [Verrucomicrobiota bacterium]
GETVAAVAGETVQSPAHPARANAGTRRSPQDKGAKSTSAAHRPQAHADNHAPAQAKSEITQAPDGGDLSFRDHT